MPIQSRSGACKRLRGVLGACLRMGTLGLGVGLGGATGDLNAQGRLSVWRGLVARVIVLLNTLGMLQGGVLMGPNGEPKMKKIGDVACSVCCIGR